MDSLTNEGSIDHQRFHGRSLRSRRSSGWVPNQAAPAIVVAIKSLLVFIPCSLAREVGGLGLQLNLGRKAAIYPLTDVQHDHFFINVV